jgi:hypothetical protein
MRLLLTEIAENIRLQDEHRSVLRIEISRLQQWHALGPYAAHGDVECIVALVSVAGTNQITLEVGFRILEVFPGDYNHLATITPTDELRLPLYSGIDQFGKSMARFGGLPNISHANQPPTGLQRAFQHTVTLIVNPDVI